MKMSKLFLTFAILVTFVKAASESESTECCEHHKTSVKHIWGCTVCLFKQIGSGFKDLFNKIKDWGKNIFSKAKKEIKDKLR